MKNFFTVLMVFSSVSILAQNNSSIQLHYGFVKGNFNYSSDLVGVPSYSLNSANEIGLTYHYSFSEKWGLETGLHLLTSSVIVQPVFMGEDIALRALDEEMYLFSIPMYANFNFAKYLYVNGGILIDFQDQGLSIDSQSGIGLGMGIGAKYDFGRFGVFTNYNFKQHALIPFKREKNHQKLLQTGLQMGIRYSF